MVSTALSSRNLAVRLFILFLVITGPGCRAGAPRPTPTPTLTVIPGGSPGGTDAFDHGCPEGQTRYSLWLSHHAVLDLDFGEGQTLYLEFNQNPPAFFDLWIYPDGSISNEGIGGEVTVSYQGTANHPDSNDCPVQTFAGTWLMRAEITGSCQDNQVNLHIREEWIQPELKSDCASMPTTGPELVSAPELDLVFDLQEEYPFDSVEVPESGPFQASYSYHLWPAGMEHPLLP